MAGVYRKLVIAVVVLGLIVGAVPVVSRIYHLYPGVEIRVDHLADPVIMVNEHLYGVLCFIYKDSISCVPDPQCTPALKDLGE